MFIAHFLPPGSKYPARVDFDSTHPVAIAARGKAADHDRVGVSLGGTVVAATAMLTSACASALPFFFGLTGMPAAACWVVAVVYVLIAGHCVRVMLHTARRSDTTQSVNTANQR